MMLKQNRNNNEIILLWVILLAGLVLRLALWKLRWINPDEGAHLLDARLLLRGLAPVADFGSRQPFYVWVISLFLRVLGVSVHAARWMPILASLGAGAVLFLIGRRLFSATHGLLAAALYTFLPLTLIWSAVVKTEPLAILLGALAVYFVVRAYQDKRSLFIVVAAIFAGLAFYVRQPTLYLPMAIGLFILTHSYRRRQHVLLFIGGYAVVVLAMFGVYHSHMSLQDFLFSQLNPLHLIWNRTLHLFGALPAEYRITDSGEFRVLDQDLGYTFRAWYESITFSLFILLGAFFSSRCYRKFASSHRLMLLFYFWAFFVVLLYLYQTLSRGFYTQYFTEALPALILLAAPFLVKIAERLRTPWWLTSLGALGIFYMLYLGQRFFWYVSPGMSVYIIASSAAAALILLFFLQRPIKIQTALMTIVFAGPISGVAFWMFQKLGMQPLPALILALLLLFLAADTLHQNRNWRRFALFPSFFAIFTTFFIAALFSGHLIGPGYEAVWRQSTLKQVSAELRQHGESSDEILSGGQIWTFESGLQPFMNVPHPTEFYKHAIDDFYDYFAANPPMFIILDGYTERKFSRYWTFVREQLAMHYEKIAEAGSADDPVAIYQFVSDAEPAPLLSEK